jgi:Flp pilus assembly protein TadB
MNAELESHSRAEVVNEIATWTVGGGIIILALFPLALPMLALTAVAALPLLVPALALAVVVVVVALPVLLIRSLAKRRVPRKTAGRRLEHLPT